MKQLRFLVLALALGAILFSLSCQPTSSQKKVKYVIYMVGDGMGLAQSSAAEAYLAAMGNEIGFRKLNLSELPVQSFLTTYSKNDYITCSAASGTAFATGYKTNNGLVSLSSDLQDTLTTIAEIAKSNNMKVGIVSSVSLDHATPAVFYAHQPQRNSYYEIGKQLVNSDFDFFGGGGFRYPDGYPDSPSDNLVKLAEENGFTYVDTKEALMSLPHTAQRVLAINPVLESGSALPYAIDKPEKSISLAEFTGKAIEILDNENGFFLMVEGGKIDWSCHNNDAATTVREVLDFDEAVGVALDFYWQHPDETLVVVFADHETGGMSLGADGMDEERAYGLLSHQKMSIDVFAGLLDETMANDNSFDEVMKLVTENFGLGSEEMPLHPLEEKLLYDAYKSKVNDEQAVNSDMSGFLYGRMDPVAVTASKLLARKAGIGWTTFNHTALPVPIRVIGPGQEKFSGYIDNTDIPMITLDILNLGN